MKNKNMWKSYTETFNEFELIIMGNSNDIKQKDIWAAMILLNILLITFILLFSMPLLSIVVITIDTIFRNLESISQGIIQVPVIDNLTNETLIKNFVLFIVLYSLGFFLSKILSKRMHNIGPIINICFNILAICIIYGIFYSILLVSFLAIILLLVPLGSGKYFKLIRYLHYFFDICKDTNPEYSFDTKKTLFIILGIIGITYSLSSLMLIFSARASFAVAIAIILAVFMNKTSDEVIKYLKKVFVYSIFILIVILGNVSIGNTPINMLVAIMTIYFTFDRVIALSNELVNIIRKNSVFYYWYGSVGEVKSGRQYMFPIAYFKGTEFTEKELVIQIIFYYRLGMVKQFNTLYSIYLNSNFRDYIIFIKSLNYSLNHEKMSDSQEYLLGLYKLIDKSNTTKNPIYTSLY